MIPLLHTSTSCCCQQHLLLISLCMLPVLLMQVLLLRVSTKAGRVITPDACVCRPQQLAGCRHALLQCVCGRHDHTTLTAAVMDTKHRCSVVQHRQQGKRGRERGRLCATTCTRHGLLVSPMSPMPPPCHDLLQSGACVFCRHCFCCRINSPYATNGPHSVSAATTKGDLALVFIAAANEKQVRG